MLWHVSMSMTGRKYGWAMERCEEKVLIACYENIALRIPANTFWKADFEDHFFRHGNGVSESYLNHVSADCRRQNHPTVVIVETAVYEYARSFDKPRKCEMRRTMLQEYKSLNPTGKIRWRMEAEAEMYKLMPPHLTLVEQESRSKSQMVSILSIRERELRAQALAQAMPVPSQPSLANGNTAGLDRATRLLRLTKKPEIIAKIVADMSPDDAFQLTEQFEGPPDVLDALIERSLGVAA
jgi:hypothetical protein